MEIKEKIGNWFKYRIFTCEVQEVLVNTVLYKIIRTSTGETVEENVSAKTQHEIMRYIDRVYF